MGNTLKHRIDHFYRYVNSCFQQNKKTRFNYILRMFIKVKVIMYNLATKIVF